MLELSLREALQLGHSYIGTEHMLLGVVREGDGVTAQVLISLGADLDGVRRQVIQMMSGLQSKEGGPGGPLTTTAWDPIESLLSQINERLARIESYLGIQ